MMTNKSPSSDLRNVWQNQKPEGILMSAEEIRRKAEKFERKIFWENALNYLVGFAGVALLSLCLMWQILGALLRLGMGLILVAVLYMVWQTHKRSPFRRMPAEMGVASCVEFHRRELERRRDLHRNVWKWSLGPAIPGLLVIMAGVAHMSPWNHSLRALISFDLMFAAIVVFAFAYAWRESQWRALKLQNQIDELNALEGRR